MGFERATKGGFHRLDGETNKLNPCDIEDFTIIPSISEQQIPTKQGAINGFDLMDSSCMQQIFRKITLSSAIRNKHCSNGMLTED